MIKYIGSKRRLVPLLLGVVDALPGVERVLDLFSGTSRVSLALKQRGYAVTANDHNTYAWVLARCFVKADGDRVRDEALEHARALAALPPRPGWFTDTYCNRARFFHPTNGARIEAAREAIRLWNLEEDLEAVLLVTLMLAADRVDSTTGVQMAYLKEWAPRALNDLELRVPELLGGTGRAWQMEAHEAAARADVDLAYLDPPYNQHSYRSNYHVWETLVRWDRPDTYGVAQKREDCRTEKSAFNSKPGILPALERALDALDCRYVLLSYNDEGHVPPDAMEAMLSSRGHWARLAVDQERYVGAKIGIHNPKGEKVGRVGRLRNRELLYVLTKVAADLEPLSRAELPVDVRLG